MLYCHSLIDFLRLLEYGVPVAAVITQPLLNLTIVHPDNATFNCSANGLPIPMVSWSNGTTALNQSEDYVVVTTTNGEENIVSMLIIITADPFDVAVYTCNVTNVVGSDMSSAFLTVHGEMDMAAFDTVGLMLFLLFVAIVAPIVESSQAVFITNEGGPVTFRCTATGVPIPSFKWFKNGTQITNNDSRISISTISSSLLADTQLNQLIQELTINETNDDDSGGYTCTATNLAGSDTASFELIVQRKIWQFS